MGYVKKIAKTLKRDGVRVLFRKITADVRLRTLPYFDVGFDLKHGVDTCGVVFHNEASDIGSDEKKTAVRYEATPVRAVRSILEKLRIDHSQYAFIDLGSGKGRVLLLASEYPFKSVTGVELSRRLHEIAANNLGRARRFGRKCDNVRSLCADATQFNLPTGPLVIFLFTPFLPAVMEQVARNIKDSLAATPRPVHIVYYGSRPEYIKLFSDMNFTHLNIYTKHPLSASADYQGHLFSSEAVSPETRS